MGGGGPGGAIHVRGRRQPDADASARDVEVHVIAGADPRSRARSAAADPGRALLAVHVQAGCRRRIEPPAVAHVPAASADREETSRRGKRRRRPAVADPDLSPDRAEGVDADLACADHRVSHRPAQESQVGDEPQDHRLVERARQAVQRLGPVRAVGDDLGEHGVEAAADRLADGDARVDADAVACRPAQPRRRAPSPAGSPPRRPRRTAAPRRRAPEADVVLREPQRLARRDPQLVGHEVATGHRLGDRVLDLQARVHLEEQELAAVVEQELDRARRA